MLALRTVSSDKCMVMENLTLLCTSSLVYPLQTSHEADHYYSLYIHNIQVTFIELARMVYIIIFNCPEQNASMYMHCTST